MSDAAKEVIQALNSALVDCLGRIQPAANGNEVDMAELAGTVDKILAKAGQRARDMRRESVMKLLQAGHKPAEIARHVDLSQSTIKKWQEELKRQRAQ